MMFAEKLREMVQWQRHSSPPVKIGDRLITLQSQSLAVRLPLGGFVWNRPSAVTVEHDGSIEELPVQDVTRTTLAASMLAAAAIGLLGWLVALAWSRPSQRPESA